MRRHEMKEADITMTDIRRVMSRVQGAVAGVGAGGGSGVGGGGGGMGPLVALAFFWWPG
jgi:hypothetical protein